MLFGNAVRKVSGNIANLFATQSASAPKFLELITGDQYGAGPSKNAKANLALYDSSPWVRANVGKIAAGFAKQKWYLERENGEKIEKHPALDFLNRGSPRLRGRMARRATVAQVILAGETYWAIGRDAKKKPVQFAPMPAHWVTQIPTEQDPTYHIQPRSGQLLRLAESDVLVLRDASPVDPYERGGSLTGAASTEIATDEAAAEFLRSFFANRARPDLLVSGDATNGMTENDRARLETSWLGRFGRGRVGRPFFSSRPLEVKEIGAGLKENDVSPLRDNFKASISEIYSIPPELLGRLENSNRATIESADFLFSLYVLTPLLDWFQDTIEPFLDNEFGLDGLKLCYESPVKDDRQFVFSVMNAKPQFFTGNDFRALVGKPPLDGLDDRIPEPAPLLGFGLPGPAADKPEPEAVDEEPEDDTAEDPEDAEDEEPETKAVAPPKIVRKTIDLDTIIRVSAAHENPSVIADGAKILDAVFAKLLQEFGAEMLAQLQNETRFQLNTRVANWLIGRGSNLLGVVSPTTRKALEDALLDGAIANDDLSALVQRVEDVFSQAADIRSAVISQTEATALTGFGAQAAGEQAGFERKEWLSSQDQAVRASHRSMNGQVVGLHEKFRSPSGAMAAHPGAFGDAAEDINCRCAMRPIIPGEKSADVKKAAFVDWQAAAWQQISASVEKEIRRVFAIQAKTCVDELRRLMAL